MQMMSWLMGQYRQTCTCRSECVETVLDHVETINNAACWVVSRCNSSINHKKEKKITHKRWLGRKIVKVMCGGECTRKKGLSVGIRFVWSVRPRGQALPRLVVGSPGVGSCRGPSTLMSEGIRIKCH